jgi:hypothetical protein
MRIIPLLLLAALAAVASAEAQPDIDALWDYDHPDQSAARREERIKGKAHPGFRGGGFGLNQRIQRLLTG